MAVVRSILVLSVLLFQLLSAHSRASAEGISASAVQPPNPLLSAFFNSQDSLPKAARLDQLYDAARARFDWISTPQSGPQPAPAPRPQGSMLVPASTPEPRKPLIVPLPASPGAYQRTFQTLLAHPEKTDRYDGIILKYARQYRLDPRLLKAIVAAESEFYRRARSPAGARGLMQLMPDTAEEMGFSRKRLFDPEWNIHAGAAYLAHLFDRALRRFKVRVMDFAQAPLWLLQRVIAAYNAGPRFLSGGHWYRQTRHYIYKVLLFYQSEITRIGRG